MILKKEREIYNNLLEYNGQAFADKFVLNCTGFKRNGYFMELGTRHPKVNNNSYILEKKFGWKGVLVDRDPRYESDYATVRTNSIPIIQDATQIDYKKVFESNNYPPNLDFMQLDLEVRDDTAFKALLKINEDILDHYRFAVLTMEHDIYTGLNNAVNTRDKSRQILKSKGYYCVFEDILDPPGVCVNSPYEDWWVHPSLVDMEYIRHLQEKNRNKLLKVNTIIGNIDCFKSHEIEY